MPSLPELLTIARRWEKRILAALVVLFILSSIVLLRRFYVSHSELAPTQGGTYIEGSVGEFLPLNPWFTVQNDVNRDIVSLVFSGLLRYNPATKSIEEDLATMQVSSDARIYTLTLRDGLEWHDSTPEDPHEVTPEDILFTFKTVQDPDFPNPLLRQNFEGVEVERISSRAVRFRLEQPYSFFPSNLTLGILPARSFAGVPVSRLNETIDFGLAPIGSGPYAFQSYVQTERSSEVTLKRFARPHDPPFYLDQIIFRIFPDFGTLLSDIRNLDGVRLVPRNERGDPIVPRQFAVHQYVLPQYVALFFNLEKPMLQDRKLRLGLQLGTNKQAVADAIHEAVLVDTPLLEIDTSDWRYQFDPASAQGALFASNWHLPEKVRLQRLLERQEANATGPLKIDPIVLLDTGAMLTVTGSLKIAGTGSLLNGVRLDRHPTQSGAWVAALPTQGSGALQIGENIVRLTKPDGTIIDTAYVWRTTNNGLYRQASEEQKLLDTFIRSRSEELPEDQRITINHLTIDRGMLRRRMASDPRDVRINDAGERLSLRLLTSPTPPTYRTVAENIARQWHTLGVHVTVEIPETSEQFEQRLLNRDYDLLVFGQSLLDNLDSYPYWHSSGIQRFDGSAATLRLDAYNLSQYASQKSDELLEVIRETSNEKERVRSLQQLREVLASDVPAIFLYSPLYSFAVSEDVSGVTLGKLSLHSDRFLTLQKWYLREERRLKDDVSWWSILPWLFGVR